MTTVVALDVGATRIKGALLDDQGRRLTEVRYPTRRGDGPATVLRRVCQVAAWLADAAVPELDVAAAGVAVCGTVDQAGLVTSVNLGWVRTDLGDAISRHIGLPVTVLNDAHAGAIGEGERGAAAGITDFLYVTLGTGIGAAIVHDGRLLGGGHGHAGELGHIIVDRLGPPCACGARGCLQTYVSSAALEQRWLDKFGTAIDAQQIIDYAIGGDPAAVGLWEEAVDALAAGLLTATSLLDPATIVFGGGLASAAQNSAAQNGAGQNSANQLLLEPLARSIQARAREFHVPAELRLAALGDWSNCAGAAAEARSLLPACPLP